MSKELGMKIRLSRVSKSISMKDLAKSISITSTYLRLIEIGTANPSVPIVKRIADTLSIPTTELLELY